MANAAATFLSPLFCFKVSIRLLESTKRPEMSGQQQPGGDLPELRGALNTGVSAYSEGLDSMARSAPASSTHSDAGDDFVTGSVSGVGAADNMTLTSHNDIDAGTNHYNAENNSTAEITDGVLGQDEDLEAGMPEVDYSYLERDPLTMAIQQAAGETYALHDLFGDYFKAPDTDDVDGGLRAPQQEAVDPMVYDLYGILRDVIGEDLIEPGAIEYLREEAHRKVDELVNACIEDDLSVLVDVVGEETAAMIKAQSNSGNNVPLIVLSAAYPYIKKPTQNHLRESNLLVTLPTVHPNCQILHLDPVPYHPQLNAPKDSTARRIYTPKNTMHWTYEPRTQQFLSNARMVQWSDGTTTVHVGSESYAMDTFTDQGLTFLGREQKLYRGDKAIDAVVEAVAVDNHVTLRPRSDVKSSVDDVISAASERRAAQDIKTKVGMQIGGIPRLGVVGSKKKSLEEEYIEKEKASLHKFAAACAKEGKPLSMMEIWAREQKILESVRAAADSMEALVARQRKEEDERKRAEAEEAARKSQLRASGGSSGRFSHGGKADRRTEDVQYDHLQAEEENAKLLQSLGDGDAVDESPTKKKARIEFEDSVVGGADGDGEATAMRKAVLAALRATITALQEKGSTSSAADMLEATYADLVSQTKVDSAAVIRKVEAAISDAADEEADFDFSPVRAALY